MFVFLKAAVAGLQSRSGGPQLHGIGLGNDAEKAKQYLLELPPVTEEVFYYVVETPQGNWGMDIDGPYLE